MNGRNRADVGWNVLLAVSIVVIFAAVFVGFYWPGKGPSKAMHQRTDVDRMADAITRVRDATARTMKSLNPRTWDLPPEELASSALDKMTALTQKNHLQLTEFRTEKLLGVGLLKEETFSSVVEGRFVDVMTLLKTLEGPDSKLAVNVLQFLLRIIIPTGSQPASPLQALCRRWMDEHKHSLSALCACRRLRSGVVFHVRLHKYCRHVTLSGKENACE